MLREPNEQPLNATVSDRAQFVIGARPRPRERNAITAIALAGVAATVLVTVVTLVLFIHYAEAHHAIAGL